MGLNKLSAVMKALAIFALLATVLGAAAVLYGVRTMTPVVETVRIEVTAAADAQDVFDDAVRRMGNRTFTGRVFSSAEGLDAQDCAFVTYTVRLNNRGFFPAEWIALTVEPVDGGEGRDVLQLPDGAHVLPAFSRGDLSATVLYAGGAPGAERTLHAVCYVLGRQIEFDVQAR